ncbi:MAG: DUF6318 family protein [Angustibacter sp.]
MSRGSQTRRVVVFFAGLAVAVAAVGLLSWFVLYPALFGPDDDDPVPPRQLPPSAVSASPSPPAGEPSFEDLMRIPADARVRTDAGARAFAEFYLDQLNAALVGADPASLRPYSASSCKSCREAIEEAEDLRGDRERYAEYSRTVVSVEMSGRSTKQKPTVLIRSIQEPARVIDQQGNTVQTFTREKGAEEFELTWQDDHWLVAKIFYIKGSDS